jgi:hypothetical protein
MRIKPAGDWVNVWQGIWSAVSCSLLFRAEFNHDQLLWTGLKDLENHRQDSLDLYSPNISFQKVLNIPKQRGFAISSLKPWGCHKFNEPEVASNKHLVLSALLTAVHGEFMTLTWLVWKNGHTIPLQMACLKWVKMMINLDKPSNLGMNWTAYPLPNVKLSLLASGVWLHHT